MKRFPSGATLEQYETLDSTSAEAKRRAQAGDSGPLWIVALRQTAGYGRRGRGWTQGAGDFAGSLLFAADAPKERFGQLSFAAALAVYDAVEALAPEGDLRLKWPNDVLLNRAKLAGLLLEMVDSGNGHALVLGVGINVVSKPQETAYPTARLLDANVEAAAAAPAALAAGLDAAFWRYVELWRGQGFAPLRKVWLERAAGLGETVTARLPNETATGIFEDIDDTGGLVLRIEEGTRIISAGDVFFGAP